MADPVIDALMSGVQSLWDYITAHILFCLIPAFFIAGAMSALLPKDKITKYLGSKVPKHKAYPVSIIAGLLLAVCSCTILPLFAGIKKKGAGLGPAIAFLYTAPATNLLAIAFTGSVLGWDLALARIILSVFFAIIIGIILSSLFEKEEDKDERSTLTSAEERRRRKRKRVYSFRERVQLNFVRNYLLIFFATLFAILIIGASGIEIHIKIIIIVILVAFLLAQIRLNIKREEIGNWLKETFMFFKTIFPILLVGVFIAGILTSLIPKNTLANYVGANTVPANLGAVLFGVFMYFPTLVEVPMAKMFLGLGMAKGPLLAYLLADPVISLPSILVVRKLIGNKTTLMYALLITIFCTIAGLIYGAFAG